MSAIREIALAKAIGGSGGGSSVTVEELTVNQNGTTTAPEGKAYNPVITNVQPPLQQKSVNANGDVTPDTGYYGLSKVVVDVQGGDVQPPLPSEYQQVEYLAFQSYTTNAIGIQVSTPTARNLYYVEFSSSTKVSGKENVAFGYRKSSSDPSDFQFRTTNESSVFIRDSSYGMPTAADKSYTVNEKITLGALLRNWRGTAFVGRYSDYSSSGVDASGLTGQFYSCKVIDPFTFAPVAWYIPCYRKSDNQVGVYDVVSGVFYYETYATGSGATISAGPDVNM